MDGFANVMQSHDCDGCEHLRIAWPIPTQVYVSLKRSKLFKSVKTHCNKVLPKVNCRVLRATCIIFAVTH